MVTTVTCGELSVEGFLYLKRICFENITLDSRNLSERRPINIYQKDLETSFRAQGLLIFPPIFTNPHNYWYLDIAKLK